MVGGLLLIKWTKLPASTELSPHRHLITDMCYDYQLVLKGGECTSKTDARDLMHTPANLANLVIFY